MADLETEVTPPVTPAEPETPPAAPPIASDEPEAVEVGGAKMVPLTALHAEREKAKTYKDKAQKYDEFYGYVQGVREEQQRRQQAEPPPPAQPSPVNDPELEELAQTLDLYTREGKPDVERAAKLMKVVDRKAEQSAQRSIQPLQQQTARERAIANFHTVSQLKTPDGRTPDLDVLRQIWNNTPVEMLADPNVANVYGMAVIGHQSLKGAPAAPASQAPPLITEAAGDRDTPFNRLPPTDLQQRVMAVRGIDSKRYADLTKNFKPGVGNALEDD